jgi:hypothetical protein
VKRAGPRSWRVALAGLGVALLLLSGCAVGGGKKDDEDAVPKPEWRVGDRWVFQRTLASGQTVVVTHQVTEADGSGYTVRIAGPTPEITWRWTPALHLSQLARGGEVLSRFEPAAMYFVWPLILGKGWSQEFDYRDGRRDGRYTNRWQVGAQIERVHTLAGSFYAVRIERWGSRGERVDTYWYSPRVRYWVRLESYANGYAEELVEFRISTS